MHSCDQRPCCEPSHLSVGTRADDVADKVAKGRQARGHGHGNARLTSFQVWQIRKIISLGRFSNYQIGGMFGVNEATIGGIRTRRNWAWLRHNPQVPIADLIPPLTFRRRI
jgi:hypothetical protein